MTKARVGILGWVGSDSAKGARALRRIAAHHETNGRAVAFVRPTSVAELMTMSGNRRLRETAVLPRVDLVHAFSGGSLVMWLLRHQLHDATAVVFDSGPFVPSARMTAAYIAAVTGVPVPSQLAHAIQMVWDSTGYADIYGSTTTIADRRRVNRAFIAELVGDRAALIVRGHTDPFLDTWPDADEAIAAFGGIERALFDAPHLMHLRDHPAAYEATLRAFLGKDTPGLKRKIQFFFYLIRVNRVAAHSPSAGAGCSDHTDASRSNRRNEVAFRPYSIPPRT
jgi:hypothetical protein